MNSSNNCNICKAYGWDNDACAGSDSNIRATGKRTHAIHRTQEEERPSKRHTRVQTCSDAGCDPKANPTILFILMKKFKEERDHWERIARVNERDNVKKDIEIQVLERVNATHLRDLQRTMETNTALWNRTETQYATLVSIGRAFPEVANIYMPWMNAETPPASPETVDLTTDEELL